MWHQPNIHTLDVWYSFKFHHQSGFETNVSLSPMAKNFLVGPITIQNLKFSGRRTYWAFHTWCDSENLQLLGTTYNFFIWMENQVLPIMPDASNIALRSFQATPMWKSHKKWCRKLRHSRKFKTAVCKKKINYSTHIAHASIFLHNINSKILLQVHNTTYSLSRY